MNTLIVNHADPADVRRFHEHVKQVDRQGKPIRWEWCAARRRRTDRQNRYYWPCFVELLRAHLTSQDHEFSADEIHHMFKQKFLTRPVFNPATGEEIGTTVRSTTELTTVEFNQYLDQIAAFLATLGLQVPAPDLYREREAA